MVATHGRGIWTTFLFPEALDPNSEKPELSMKIFPNPGDGIININFSPHTFSKLRVQVYSLSGKLEYQTELEQADSQYGYRINLSALPPGVYLVNAIAGNARYTQRIILQ